MARLLPLLLIALLAAGASAATTSGVAAAEVDYQPDEQLTESQCRPYIEKALRQAGAGPEDGDAEDDTSGEPPSQEAPASGEEVAASPEVGASEEVTASGETFDTVDEEGGPSAEARASEEATTSTEAEDAAEDDTASEEPTEDADEEEISQEAEANQEAVDEEAEASVEGGTSTEAVEEDVGISAEAADDDTEASTEAEDEASPEVLEEYAGASTEAEAEASTEAVDTVASAEAEASTEAGEEDAGTSAEAEAEASTEAVEEDAGASAEAEAITDAEASAEAELEASPEAVEEDAGASTEAEASTEALDDAEASAEPEASTEAVEDLTASAEAEVSTEAVEEASAEAEAETSTENVQEDTGISMEAEASTEAVEDTGVSAEVQESTEAADEDTVASAEEAGDEGAEEDTALSEEGKGVISGEVAEEGVSGEAVVGDAASGEEAAEEELGSDDIEVPDLLRPRDHLAPLLHLDQPWAEPELLQARAADAALKELKRLYDQAIKPLETLYKYRDLSNRHFGDPEIFSKPLVLFMGPWSGGKSTIINYLLDNEWSRWALRSGAEPSPAYFNLVTWGERSEVVDGTQLAADWTFSGLQKFGQGLLDRLRGLRLNVPLLEKVNIVEIPGILEVRKQVERVFPFNDACQWFIDRADIIFLVYDPAKLDVGPETEAILDQLKGREYQTRILLNKADQVRPEELMRVQGTLIWNISPLMASPEPPVMYSVSLWSHPYEAGAPTRLLQAQERAFLRDLRAAVDRRVENKMASARRFAVRVRNHAKMVDCYLTTYYNHKGLFGNRKTVSDDIIERPQNYHIYEGLSTLTNISRYDLPDPDVYRDFFRLNPLYDFPLLSSTCTYFRGCPINRLDIAIAYDLPELVGKYKKAVDEATTGATSKTAEAAVATGAGTS